MIKIEIRKKIVEARAKGLKIAELSKAYGYSESAINRLLRLLRENGDITPKTYLRGRNESIDKIETRHHVRGKQRRYGA